jgi:hypothetical protein
MIIEILANVVLWINAFPPASGVSKTYSPRTIMAGTALDFNKHCQIPFGAYAEVHEDRNITNTMSEQTQPAICLGPTANFQGSYKFISLRTGKRITRKQFKELPMPDSIIKRVEAMAEREQQDKTITFGDRSRNEITKIYDSPVEDTDEAAAGVYDGDHGPDDGPNNEATNEAPGIAVEQPESSVTPGMPDEDGVTPGVPAKNGMTPGVTAEDGVTPGVTAENEENPEVTHREITGVAPEGIATGTIDNEGTTGSDDNPPPLVPSGTEYESDDDDDDEGANNGVETSHNEISEDQVYHPDSMTPSIQRVHGLRPRKSRDYSHMHSHATIMHHAMTQYSLKKGLRKFQKVGEEAVSKELKQLHMRETFTPQHSDDLSNSQKHKALESLMFLKEKRDGTIKGRACADGRKQRETAVPGAATSPTVALESVLITATIDAYEERDVAIVDVPGAFLSADMDEEVIMTIRGRLAELMVKAAPNIYRKYITLDAENQPILYVKLQKALYGCLTSALLFYEKLVRDLKSQRFEINQYDPCVAIKLVNGEQFTLTWHVDDIKMSHKDSNEVTKVIEWLKGIYGDNMHVSRGLVHEYLGMTLDYTVKGEVKITMVDYLKGLIGDFPEVIDGTAPTAASEHLFNVRPDEERVMLEEELARAFHHAVAQLLFASSGARKDIQLAVSFLTTRVR